MNDQTLPEKVDRLQAELVAARADAEQYRRVLCKLLAQRVEDVIEFSEQEIRELVANPILIDDIVSNLARPVSPTTSIDLPHVTHTAQRQAV